jgi:hypothetical protein
MSFQLPLDVFFLLLMATLTATVLLGWGNLTWRFLSMRQPRQPSTVTVWLGFCIVTAAIEVIHLFLPIDWKVTIAVAVIGFVGVCHHKNAFPFVESAPSDLEKGGIALKYSALNLIKRYPLQIAGGSFVVLSWCLLAMQAPTMFDSGLYHFGSIRWLNEYAIVPGLGNLHWRLALNQSYFGFLALLNIEPYWDNGYAVGGLFLLLLTLCTLVEAGIKQSMLWRWIFGGILFSYLCLLSAQIANPMPDTAVALVQIAIFVFLNISLTWSPHENTPSRVTISHVQIVLLFLCVTIVTIKLSSVGFAAASFCIVVLCIVRSRSQQWPYLILIKTSIVISVLSLVHVGRSYLLSGAPFFPSPIGGIWSLSWAVPYGVASHESQLIYAWAKQAGVQSISDIPKGFEWVSAWIVTVPKTMTYLLLTSTVLLIFSAILRRRPENIHKNKLHFIIVPIVVAFVFWFLTAPDPRFLGAMVVLYFACTLYFFSLSIDSYVIRQMGSFRATGQTVLSFIVFAGLILFFIRWSLLSVSAPYGWRPLPLPEREIHVSRLGYKAYVPIVNAQCWATALPCAVVVHDALLQRPLSDIVPWYTLQPHRFSLSIDR